MPVKLSPPGRWQDWQFFWRIGSTSREKVGAAAVPSSAPAEPIERQAAAARSAWHLEGFIGVSSFQPEPMQPQSREEHEGTQSRETCGPPLPIFFVCLRVLRAFVVALKFYSPESACAASAGSS